MQASLDKTPCSSRAVDGFVRGAIIGLAWGSVIGGHAVYSSGHRGMRLAGALSRSVATSVGSFGGLLGCYSGATCLAERVRGRSDWINAAAAGAVTGAAIGLPTRSPQVLLQCMVITSTVTAASTLLMQR